mgnify:CR=1 FL=1
MGRHVSDEGANGSDSSNSLLIFTASQRERLASTPSRRALPAAQRPAREHPKPKRRERSGARGGSLSPLLPPSARATRGVFLLSDPSQSQKRIAAPPPRLRALCIAQS